jgi:hypothetical protein
MFVLTERKHSRPGDVYSGQRLSTTTFGSRIVAKGVLRATVPLEQLREIAMRGLEAWIQLKCPLVGGNRGGIPMAVFEHDA